MNTGKTSVAQLPVKVAIVEMVYAFTAVIVVRNASSTSILAATVTSSTLGVRAVSSNYAPASIVTKPKLWLMAGNEPRAQS